MPVAFSAAVAAAAESVATVSTTLNPSGSDRYAVGALLTGDGGGITHDDMDLGVLSFDQLGSTNAYGAGFFLRTSAWGAVAPATGSQTASGDSSATPSVIAMAMAAYSGVNQSAPIGTVYTNSGNFNAASGAASVTVTDAVAGDTIVARVYARNESSGVALTLTSAGTERAQQNAAFQPTVGLFEFVAGADSPSVSVTISAAGGAEVAWEIRAHKLISAGAPPVIVAQPANQEVAPGASATFSVSATFTGSGPTYQWQDNRTGSFTNVADGTGGTTASYTTATAGQAFQGRLYRCVVSDSDGTTNTDAASLAVIGFPVYLWSTAVQSGNDVWLRDPTAFAAGAGLSVGVAVETDTALPLAARKLRAIGLAAETDTALARTLARVKATGLAIETDAALALTLRKVASIGVSVETDTATARPLVKQRAAGLAVETDTALASALRKSRAVGRSDETDTALALSFAGSITVGRADETDTAQARALRKVLAVGVATEADSAQAIALRKARPTATAVETDSAQAVSLRKVGAVGRANESDQALALTLIGPLQVGVAEEADAALAPQVRKVVTVSAATEADTALAVALVKRMAVGPSVETDTAIALAFAQPFVVRRADETDTALALSFVAGVPALPTAGAHASIRPKRGRARSMPAWLREKEPDKTRAVDEAAPADQAAQTRLAQAAAMREAAERLLSEAD